MQAEAAAAEQLARTFLRLRDYANTPIQTIAFTTELIRAKNHDLKPILDRLERAVEKLTELSHALTRYENAHKWSPGDESLDATMMDEQLFGSEPRRLRDCARRSAPKGEKYWVRRHPAELILRETSLICESQEQWTDGRTLVNCLCIDR